MSSAAGYLKKLTWPTLLVLVVLLPGWPIVVEQASQAAGATRRVLGYFFGVAIGVALAWWIVRLIDVFFWGVIVARSRVQVPRLLKDIVAALVFLVMGITILELVFKQSVAGLWATTGVVGLVVGMALRFIIADVFSGIAINIDQSFRIGQWVRVHPRSVEPLEGRVKEIGWRCTRIWTKDNTIVVLPNHLIASSALINCSEPETRTRFSLNFSLSLTVPPDRALRVLLGGARAAEGPLKEPAPTVSVNRVTDAGVEYRVRYWLEPAQVSPKKARHAVTKSILEHLHHAGFTLARPQRDIFHARLSSRQLENKVEYTVILKRAGIFSGLAPVEINRLASHVTEHRFAVGQSIVKKGEIGDSMYVLAEGLLDVYTTSEANPEFYRVDSIKPGEFFGEMGMLTGAPRSATVTAVTEAVVLEIKKADFSCLLEDRPEIARHISHVIADRREAMIAKGRVIPTDPGETKESFAELVFKKIKSFFSNFRPVHGPDGGDRLPKAGPVDVR